MGQGERRAVIDGANRRYDDLRQDDAEWSALMEEYSSLDGTLLDGLDPGETWTESGATVHRSSSSIA